MECIKDGVLTTIHKIKRTFDIDEQINSLAENLDEGHSVFINHLMCGTEISIDDITTAIYHGLNPHYNNDILLVKSCVRNDDTITRFLIDYGCDINAHASEALIMAFFHSRPKTAELLLSNGININKDVIGAAIHSGLQYVDMLVKHGVDIEIIFQTYFDTEIVYLVNHQWIEHLKYFAKHCIGMDDVINKMT